MENNKVSIKEIKNYWEGNTPQYWYSDKKTETREYYDEIQKKRYSQFYPYLLKYAEFNNHPNEKVLEVGCGQGTDLLQFAKGGSDVFGVDLAESAIKKAEKLFKVYDYKVQLKSLDAENLKIFKDNSFNVVYSFGVIHHTTNPQNIIDEIHRVLKPGGKAIIMLYSKGMRWFYYLFLYLFMGKFLTKSLQDVINENSEYKGNCPFAAMYSVRETREMFKKFKEVNIQKLLLYNMVNDKSRPLLKRIVIGAASKLPFQKYILNEKIFGDNLFIKSIK